MSASEEDAFENLLQFVQQARGFDFRGYKRAGLLRRAQRRMQEAGVAGFASYRDDLELHPGGLDLLFDALVLKVTAFFRDPPAWDFLRREVVPALLAKADGEPVRVWSAGCASGEEAYSAAMLLAEAMGETAFREHCTVYATDVDEGALARASLASYRGRELEAVAPALRDRWFERMDGRYMLRAGLRDAVIFGRHDLVRDAPLRGLDLVICRHTLMYFDRGTQASVLARLHSALGGGSAGTGVLFLGGAERMLPNPDLFSPLDRNCGVFAKGGTNPAGFGTSR